MTDARQMPNFRGAKQQPKKKARARECSEETNFFSCLWLFGLLLKTEHMGKPWNNESAEKWWACGRHVRQKELAPRFFLKKLQHCVTVPFPSKQTNSGTKMCQKSNERITRGN